MSRTRGRGLVGTYLLSSESLRMVRADERKVLNSPRSGFIERQVDEDGRLTVIREQDIGICFLYPMSASEEG